MRGQQGNHREFNKVSMYVEWLVVLVLISKFATAWLNLWASRTLERTLSHAKSATTDHIGFKI